MSGEYLLTSDGLGKNSMQYEIGRGGYFPASSGTTETQSMLIKGACAAYRATGYSLYLDRAKLWADALIKYFYFNTEPPESGTWPCQWIVNAGSAVEVQGPISSVSPVYSGEIGTIVAFTNGEATIADLSTVYLAASSSSVLEWENVFSGLASGTQYTIAYYYDKTGAKFDGNRNPLGVTDVTKAGLIKLSGAQATFTGNVLLNYSIYVSGTTIPFGSNFECWPMWRELEPGEWKCAADSIHWTLDAFQELFELDVTQTARWGAAVAATLRNWDTCLTLDTSTYAFKAEVDKRYDSWPLTYYKAIVDGEAVVYPSTYLTIDRDEDGYISAELPLDATRSDFGLYNENLFITGTWTAETDKLVLGLGASIETPLEIILKDTSGNAYHMRWTLSAGSTPATPIEIPLSWFNASYSWGGASSPCWDEGSGIQYHGSIPTTADGFGFAQSWATAPAITYNLTAGAISIRATGNNGATTTVACTSGAHTVTPAMPSGATSITNIDFIATANGTNTIVVNTPDGIVNNTSPLMVGTIELHFNNTAATTIKVGDVHFAGAPTRTAIPYNGGALPFQLSSDNPATGGTMATAANFQGPYYMGYQNPCPFIHTEEYDKALIMLTMLEDAQTAYTASVGIVGPFAPVYLPNTWDGVMFGAQGFGWDGPDPNTFWGGFQYRPYAAIADFYQRCVERSVSNTAVTKAGAVAGTFLTWLDTWLTEHPDATCVPMGFYEGVSPTTPYNDPSCIAVALKGTLFLKKALVNDIVVDRVIERLYKMLVRFNITSGDMFGSFTPDPANGVCYGYWMGEIMETLALYIQIVNK